MAEVKTIDIDGIQWSIKDQTARDKITEQNTKIENLTAEISKTEDNCKRFFYNIDVDKNVLQNRIDAMIYCYKNSKSGVATIRYSGGYYYNVIIPSADLNLSPIFTEITYEGHINTFMIKNNTEFQIIRSI